MCAFEKDPAASRSSRRRTALIAGFVPLFVVLWLLVLPHAGPRLSGDLVRGLGAGVGIGVGIVALVRGRTRA